MDERWDTQLCTRWGRRREISDILGFHSHFCNSKLIIAMRKRLLCLGMKRWYHRLEAPTLPHILSSIVILKSDRGQTRKQNSFATNLPEIIKWNRCDLNSRSLETPFWILVPKQVERMASAAADKGNDLLFTTSNWLCAVGNPIART